MSDVQSESALSSLSLVGRVWGEVRRLQAFDKKRHTVPDQVNGATSAFLCKLCADEIDEDGEELFQAARRHFGYKRKEISLTADTGMAQLRAKDFLLEIRCELDGEDASQYFIETEVKKVASKELLLDPAFTSTIGNRFDRLRIRLNGKVSVESVIDAVEEDESGELSIDYPSDCSECSVRIEGLDAVVHMDGQVLEVRYSALTTAAALVVAFDGMEQRIDDSLKTVKLLG